MYMKKLDILALEEAVRIYGGKGHSEEKEPKKWFKMKHRVSREPVRGQAVQPPSLTRRLRLPGQTLGSGIPRSFPPYALAFALRYQRLAGISQPEL